MAVLTCEYDGVPFNEPRSHPWTDTAGRPECRYYDLTREPSLIRRSLEDFRPWRHYAAVEDFYVLLAALNRPASPLETNDCAFDGPHENENPAFEKSLQCDGRVMVLFRNLERNTIAGEVEQLAHRLHRNLAETDPTLRWGVIGTSIIPVRYLGLPEVDGRQQGSQLMISFWAWGDSEAECMRYLRRVLKNLSSALLKLPDAGCP